MFSNLYNQVMRSRLGLGQRFDGYGGFGQTQQLDSPSSNPWSAPSEFGRHPVDPIGLHGVGGPAPSEATNPFTPQPMGPTGQGGFTASPEAGRFNPQPRGPFGQGGMTPSPEAGPSNPQPIGGLRNVTGNPSGNPRESYRPW